MKKYYKYIDVLGLRLLGMLPSAYTLNSAVNTVLLRGLSLVGYYVFFQLQQRNRYILTSVTSLSRILRRQILRN